MFRNYVKIALKVFWRHRFFTAVNLFGICFTLVVLMVAAAFIDQQVGPVPPEVHAGRTLYLNWLIVQHASAEPPRPVIWKPSYAFLDRYVRTLEDSGKGDRVLRCRPPGDTRRGGGRSSGGEIDRWGLLGGLPL